MKTECFVVFLVFLTGGWAFAAYKPKDQTFLQYMSEKESQEKQRAELPGKTGLSDPSMVPLSSMSESQKIKDQQAHSLCSSARINPRYYFPTNVVPYDVAVHRTAVTTLFRKHFDYPESRKYFVPEVGEYANVIKCGTLIVGFMVHSYKAKDIAHIEHMAIHDCYQGFGFGAVFIDMLKANAQANGLKKITVSPLSKAETYYIQHKFKKTHPQLSIYELTL